MTDLHDLSRFEAGRPGLTPTRERASDLLRVASEATRPLAEAKCVAISVEVRAEDALVCDRGRVLQVLANLLGNALDMVAAILEQADSAAQGSARPSWRPCGTAHCRHPSVKKFFLLDVLPSQSASLRMVLSADLRRRRPDVTEARSRRYHAKRQRCGRSGPPHPAPRRPRLAARGGPLARRRRPALHRVVLGPARRVLRRRRGRRVRPPRRRSALGRRGRARRPAGAQRCLGAGRRARLRGGRRRVHGDARRRAPTCRRGGPGRRRCMVSGLHGRGARGRRRARRAQRRVILVRGDDSARFTFDGATYVPSGDLRPSGGGGGQ